MGEVETLSLLIDILASPAKSTLLLSSKTSGWTSSSFTDSDICVYPLVEKKPFVCVFFLTPW